MLLQKDYKFWFCTGSQDLYGEECLQHVAEHSAIIVDRLNQSGILPFEVVLKPTLQRGQHGRKLCRRDCVVPHLFPGKVLDSGTAGVSEAAAASAHPV